MPIIPSFVINIYGVFIDVIEFNFIMDRVRPLAVNGVNKTGETTDNGLMLRIQTDLNEAALEVLVCRYSDKALAVATQILSDRVEAEDAVQEAFLRVIHKRHLFKPGKDFSAWFYTILRNVCLDILRKHKKEASLFKNVAQPEAVAPQHSDFGETLATLCACLNESEKSVLLLRVVHELRFSEIAAALGLSEEAAKKQAQRALRKLRTSTHRDFFVRKEVV